MVTIATWNVENLFRAGVVGGPQTVETYERKLAALAATIDQIAPDVLALQEIGDPAALDDLVARLAPPPGGSWAVVLSAFPDERGIRVAVLSGLPVRASGDVVDLAARLRPVQEDDRGPGATRMGRGALRVQIGAEDQPFHILTCHLKSKLLSYPDGRFAPRNEDERARYAAYALYRRAAEATTVRTEANAVLEGDGQRRRLVVLGDLNDTEQAATTQTLLGPGGSEIGTAGFDVPDQGDAWRLWNLAGLIPEERRYSRVYRGRRELIDHALISHALLGDVAGADSLVEGLPSVTDDPRARRAATGSDHAPVVVQLQDRYPSDPGQGSRP